MLNKTRKSVKTLSRLMLAIQGLCLLLITLLSGCATHVSKPDGPPPFYVDVNKIPNAKPKLEPLSKYGNQPYVVFGKRYYVMNSSKNYHAYGIASWYGTKFHQRHTSSGERYDMLSMTAAHKSLPLPTYLEVKNLNNGRKVIVKVNDRGPFERNRLIDLSYAAAKKLGVVGPGTARVELRAIDPRNYQRRPNTGRGIFFAKRPVRPIAHLAKHTTSARHKLYLQVGAFKSRAQAEKLRKTLVRMVASPIKITPTNHLYHVQIGPIKDATMVAKINKRLKSIGLYSRTMLG